ncbi:MAG TPA: CARDB domain-containing protein [Gemmatimonadaceae bacterium]
MSACQDGPTGPTTGSLVVEVMGLPAGVAGAVTISGPAGFSRTVTRTDTLASLAPGSYVLRTGTLRALGGVWVPPAPEQAIEVTASRSAQLVAVAYLLATGSVHVRAPGLPPGAAAALTLSGPNFLSRTVAAGDTVRELPPGEYTLTAAAVSAGHHRYAPSAPTKATVTASLTPAELQATYAVSSAAIAIASSGLPEGTLLQATVTRPGQPTTLAFAGDTAWGFEPGSYTVGFNSVMAADQTWAPDAAQLQLTAAAAEAPTLATMHYTVATGSLTLTASGLPEGAKPSFTVAYPTGGTVSLTTTTIHNLVPGEYAVRADSFMVSGIIYDPVQVTSKATVTRGAVATLDVAYRVRAGTAPGGPLNLTIDGMYVTQAVQSYDGAIPLVAGRAAMVRVFVKANTTNAVAPVVRVRVLNNGSTVATYTIPPSIAAAPMLVDQGSAAASWNVVIPKSLVAPGLQVIADVDPANAIAEGNEGDNTFPANGTPRALTVRAVPTVDMTFVPVLVTASGLQGDLSAARVDSMMMSAMAVHPISGYTAEVHAPFTTAAPALDANDASGGWIRILSEVQALRAAEGSARMYYGVVKVPYGSGVAGYGYVGFPAAIGWDYLPSGAAVLAHEIGHNFGRQHTPCGGPAGPDPQYPFPDGKIGIYGWSERRNVIIQPTASDIMGYCGNQWISEYTYRAVMDFRGYLAGSAQSVASPAASRAVAPSLQVGATDESSLLVWGRIRGRAITLEPSFQLTTKSALPRRGGDYTLRGLDAAGSELFALAFDGEAVADAPAHDRTFAFAVPVSAATRAQLARIVVTGRDGSRAESAIAAGGDDPAVTVTRRGTAKALLRWDATRHPMVLVRDPATGKILSFARGGTATVATRSAEVEVRFGNRRMGAGRRVRVE